MNGNVDLAALRHNLACHVAAIYNLASTVGLVARADEPYEGAVEGFLLELADWLAHHAENASELVAIVDGLLPPVSPATEESQ